jgi:hypothetical protein
MFYAWRELPGQFSRAPYNSDTTSFPTARTRGGSCSSVLSTMLREAPPTSWNLGAAHFRTLPDNSQSGYNKKSGCDSRESSQSKPKFSPALF